MLAIHTILIWKPGFTTHLTALVAIFICIINGDESHLIIHLLGQARLQGGGHSITKHTVGWLEGLSQNPQNIYPKIAILEKC